MRLFEVCRVCISVAGSGLSDEVAPSGRNVGFQSQFPASQHFQVLELAACAARRPPIPASPPPISAGIRQRIICRRQRGFRSEHESKTGLALNSENKIVSRTRVMQILRDGIYRLVRGHWGCDTRSQLRYTSPRGTESAQTANSRSASFKNG